MLLDEVVEDLRGFDILAAFHQRERQAVLLAERAFATLRLPLVDSNDVDFSSAR